MIEQNTVSSRLRRLYHAMAQHCTRDVKMLELTAVQGSILGYLTHHREQKHSAGELARQFGMSVPTISGILQRLQSKGFVCTQPDETDRRRKWVTVTEKALCCDAEMHRKIAGSEEAMTAGLSDEELVRLTALLDRLIANLTANSTNEGGSSLD